MWICKNPKIYSSKHFIYIEVLTCIIRIIPYQIDNLVQLKNEFVKKKKNLVCGRIWPNFEHIQAHRYLQVWKGSHQKQPTKRGVAVFPIITLWELSVTMGTKSCDPTWPKT